MSGGSVADAPSPVIAAASSGGSLALRDAAHNASCPPAECPTSTMRVVSSVPIALSELTNEVHRTTDVVECARPSAAVVADAPILGDPDRVAGASERRGCRRDVREIVGGPPASAMDEDHDGRERSPGRQPQLTELQRAGAVRLAMVRGRRRVASSSEYAIMLFAFGVVAPRLPAGAPHAARTGKESESIRLEHWRHASTCSQLVRPSNPARSRPCES